MISCLSFVVVPPGLVYSSKISTFHGLYLVRVSNTGLTGDYFWPLGPIELKFLRQRASRTL